MTKRRSFWTSFLFAFPIAAQFVFAIGLFSYVAIQVRPSLAAEIFFPFMLPLSLISFFVYIRRGVFAISACLTFTALYSHACLYVFLHTNMQYDANAIIPIVSLPIRFIGMSFSFSACSVVLAIAEIAFLQFRKGDEKGTQLDSCESR